MGVYDTATKLASEIKNSKEYKEFKKCMKDMKKDKDSEALLKQYRVMQMEMRSFTIKRVPIDKKSKKMLDDMQRKISENKTVRNYLNSEKRLTALMENINNILAQAVEKDYE